jgi:hypothetical protein
MLAKVAKSAARLRRRSWRCSGLCSPARCHRSGISVLLVNKRFPQLRTQAPHRHQSVALDFV